MSGGSKPGPGFTVGSLASILASAERASLAGDYTGAEETLRQVCTQRPRNAVAWRQRGLNALRSEAHAAALRYYEQALALEPEAPEALNNMGLAHLALYQTAAAANSFEAALALLPGNADIRLNLANALRQACRFEVAADQYRALIEDRPDDHRAHVNLAFTLSNLNRPHDAIRHYEHALALRPQDPAIRKSLGIAQLQAGEFLSGWANYEARFETGEMQARGDGIPPWQGACLNGKRILLYAEQGFGDTLQFCRYAPLVAETAEQVVLECQPPLLGLLRSLDPRVVVVARGTALPTLDCRAPLMSLPRLTGRGGSSLTDIPAGVPYLRPSDAAMEAWRSRIAAITRPGSLKVGLVWRGNPKRQDDPMRSCPPESLLPIAGATAISCFGMQIGPRSDHDAALLGTLNDLAPQLVDFEQTAAAMMQMDLIVSVDTAAAHLAGALARPVWVMLGYASDWRYLTERSESPWYPTMRLFRQRVPGDWRGLTEAVRTELEKLRPSSGLA